MERLHIELQRVQTWLFAVPRLRAMVGANALLGETLRVALPNLARETGRGWMLAPSTEAYPGVCVDDSLMDDSAPDQESAIAAKLRASLRVGDANLRAHSFGTNTDWLPSGFRRTQSARLRRRCRWHRHKSFFDDALNARQTHKEKSRCR